MKIFLLNFVASLSVNQRLAYNEKPDTTPNGNRAVSDQNMLTEGLTDLFEEIYVWHCNVIKSLYPNISDRVKHSHCMYKPS